MGIFSNLGKRSDSDVGIPDVDAWLESDDDEFESDALMDMPPPPQPDQFVEERRAPVAEIPESLAPAASNDSPQGLWNLPDMDDADNGVPDAVENLQLDAPSSLPSIAEIQQGMPPAGFGGLDPINDGVSSPSTGFEGLSNAVGGTSADRGFGADNEDIRWDVDVVKYEPEVPDALKPADLSAPSIPMPGMPPAGMDLPSVDSDMASIDSDFEVSSFEAPALDTPAFDAPALDAPSFDAPAFDTPSLDAPAMPSADLPDMPDLPAGFDQAPEDLSIPTMPPAPSFVDANPSLNTDLETPSLEMPTFEAEVPGNDIVDFGSDTTESTFALDNDLLAPAFDQEEPVLTNTDVDTTAEADAPPSESDGFSLSSFFGRKKGKQTEADGFADLREPVADDPFGNNIGLGISDAPTQTGAETMAGFTETADPAHTNVPIAEAWGGTQLDPSADEIDADEQLVTDEHSADEHSADEDAVDLGFVDDDAFAPMMGAPAIVAPMAADQAFGDTPNEVADDIDLSNVEAESVIDAGDYVPIHTLKVPDGPQAAEMLEILGLDEDATWGDARDARRMLLAEHNPDDATDEERAALAKAICREMNTAYAALRLLHVA